MNLSEKIINIVDYYIFAIINLRMPLIFVTHTHTHTHTHTGENLIIHVQKRTLKILKNVKKRANAIRPYISCVRTFLRFFSAQRNLYAGSLSRASFVVLLLVITNWW